MTEQEIKDAICKIQIELIEISGIFSSYQEEIDEKIEAMYSQIFQLKTHFFPENFCVRKNSLSPLMNRFALSYAKSLNEAFGLNKENDGTTTSTSPENV